MKKPKFLFGSMMILIWWYLVAYEPGVDILQDLNNKGKEIGEYQKQSDCEAQLDIYYGRLPRTKRGVPIGFAQCQGFPVRQQLSAPETRKSRDLEMKKLELEVESKALEVQFRRKLLESWSK